MSLRQKKIFKITIQMLLTIAIFVIIFKSVKIDLLETFRSVDFRFVLCACFLRIFVLPLIYVNRWKLFLSHSGVNESFWSLLKISMVAAFTGIALPSSQGPDVMRMIMIETRHPHADLHNGTSSSTVLMERIIGFVILALTGLIFSCVTDYPQKTRVIMVILSINIALWMAIFLITNKYCYSKLSGLLNRISPNGKIAGFVEKTYKSFVMFPYKDVLLSSVLLILALQLCTILIAYLCFLAFGVHIPFVQHLAFYPIIAILSIVPVTISGLGLREGFFVSFYSLLGVEPAVAVSVSLMNYCIEMLLMAVLGGILYLLKIIGLVKV